MVDFVKLTIQAGDGGDGRISFLRTRYQPKGGPDGGDGGNGGNVVVVGSAHMHTLRDFAGKHILEAENGKMGGKRNMHGHNSDDVMVKVPVGTKVWRIVDTHTPVLPKRMYRIDRELGRIERAIHKKDGGGIVERGGVFQLSRSTRAAQESKQDTWDMEGVANEGCETAFADTSALQVDDNTTTITLKNASYAVRLVGEIIEDGQTLLVASGGRGGRGNFVFRSSRNTTPLEAETGEKGERGEYILELNVLADVGLVGYPNAGKSTLLAVLTHANPKIANYPFTTLEPNLGVLEFPANDPKDRRSLVIADIPGIIEGASEGKGLGLEFLRHIARCKILVFVLGLDDGILLGESEHAVEELASLYEQQYNTLEAELTAYVVAHTALLSLEQLEKKARIVLLGKADLLPDDRKEGIKEKLASRLPETSWISGKTGEGKEHFLQRLQQFT